MPIQITDVQQSTPFNINQTGLLFNLPYPEPGTEQKPEGISLCMIVKNEQRFLSECLESIKDVVDEINIVDTGSTDRTVEIAKQYGANVIHREWRNDFAWARNESLKMATRRWIIVLDADEELARESQTSLRALRAVPAAYTAPYVQIVNTVTDESGLGTMSHNLPRIFPNHEDISYRGVIHESIVRREGHLLAALTPIKLIHKGYTPDVLASKSKSERNIPLLERAMLENGNDPFSLFNFGVTALGSPNPENGVEALEKMFAVAEKPLIYFPIAAFMLAIYFTEQKHDPERGLALLDKTLEEFPYDANCHFSRGIILAQTERYDEARAAYDKVLELRTHGQMQAMVDDELFQWKTFVNYAATYVREGSLSEAVPWYERALANKPNSPLIRQGYANLLERLERYYDADIAYRAWADIDPAGRVEYINYLFRRKRFSMALSIIDKEFDDLEPAVSAKLNFEAARIVEAESLGDPVPYLERALRGLPGHGHAIGMLERFYRERGDDQRLQRLWADELVASCVSAIDFARRSHRLLELKRFEEAATAARAGLALDADESSLRFNLALAEMRAGNRESAVEEFARVNNDRDDIFQTAMSMCATTQAELGRFDDALDTVARWREHAGDAVDTTIARARVLESAGRSADAELALRERFQSDRRIALELVGMLMKNGRLAEAGDIATQVLA